MKWNNAFIIGDGATDASGSVSRVKPGGIEYVTQPSDLIGDKICLSSLDLPDQTLDACIEYVFEKKPKLFVRACEDLYGIGLIEAKYRLSPIMLLHKMGLLDQNCTVVGAVYLDNDDVAIMSQCGCSVVLCPTMACGYGNGFVNVMPLLGKVDVSLGSGDNRYNASGSIIEEAKTLLLGTSCIMRKRDALSLEQIAGLIGFEGDIKELVRLMNIQ